MSILFGPAPEFQTGDLLSAARLNTMLDEIDVLAGLDEQRIVPVDGGAHVERCTVYGRPMYSWINGERAIFWFAHHGDRLKVYVNGAENAYLWWNWNGVWPPSGMSTHVLTGNVENTITVNTSGLYPYQPVRVLIARIVGQSNLWVRYVYQTDSNAPAIGALPTFPDGTPSNAAHLNTVLSAISAGAANLLQPVPCQYSQDDRVGSHNGYTGYLRHTHGRFIADVTVTTQGVSPGEYAFLNLADTNVWAWTPTPGNMSYDSQRDGLIDVAVPAGVAVGDWYKVHFEYHRSGQNPPSNTGIENEQRLQLWSYGETPGEALAHHDLTTRWTHGDIIRGSTGAAPRLDAMSSALTSVAQRLRWINQPCREAGTEKLNEGYEWCVGAQLIDSMSAHRVHRWLAYENFPQLDGQLANAQIQWFTAGRNLQSYTLPAVNVPSFFDLESTPIKPGMWFRLSGVLFGIQTPKPGADYA